MSYQHIVCFKFQAPQYNTVYDIVSSCGTCAMWLIKDSGFGILIPASTRDRYRAVTTCLSKIGVAELCDIEDLHMVPESIPVTTIARLDTMKSEKSGIGLSIGQEHCIESRLSPH